MESPAQLQTTFLEKAIHNMDNVERFIAPNVKTAVDDLEYAPKPVDHDQTMIYVLEVDGSISEPTDAKDTGDVTDGLASHALAALSFQSYIEHARSLMVELQDDGDVARFDQRIAELGTATRTEILQHVLCCFKTVPEIAHRVKSVFEQFEVILNRVTSLAQTLTNIAKYPPGTKLLVNVRSFE